MLSTKLYQLSLEGNKGGFTLGSKAKEVPNSSGPIVMKLFFWTQGVHTKV